MNTSISDWIAEECAASTRPATVEIWKQAAAAGYTPDFAFEVSPPSSVLWPRDAHDALLREIASLPADWNGRDAVRVGSKVTDQARSVLDQLGVLGVAPNLISPTPLGTVLFEWETQLGAARLEIGRTTFSFYTCPNVGEPILYGGPIGGLNATNVRDALATIAPDVPSSCLAIFDSDMGVEIWPATRAA